MAGLMRTAQKVTDLLTKSEVCMNYYESALVLKIVLNTIREITGEEV
jgi:hypothetical protein